MIDLSQIPTGLELLALIPFFLISFGGGGGSESKSKSSSDSRVLFNRRFLAPFFNAFPMPLYSNDQEGITVEDVPAGPSVANPKYPFPSSFKRQQMTIGIPKFKGLEDMDFEKLQENLYKGAVQNLNPSYEQERSRRREELSQSGLLTSPAQYGEGGAIDTLDDDYFANLEKAATESSIATTTFKQQELARKTGFDLDLAAYFNEVYTRMMAAVIGAGQRSTSRGSSSSDSGGGFNFGFLTSGGSKSSGSGAK